MKDFEARYPTIGAFLEADPHEVARVPFMGRVRIRNVYGALDLFTADIERRDRQNDRGQSAPTSSEASSVGGEVTLLMEIELRLAETPMPDGSPRRRQDIAQAAIAIYWKLSIRTASTT